MLSLANKGIEERNQRDLEELEKVARKLEAGQVALERKALLYEKYKSGDYKVEDLEDDRLLVDFERKEWEGADEKVREKTPEKVRLALPSCKRLFFSGGLNAFPCIIHGKPGG